MSNSLSSHSNDTKVDCVITHAENPVSLHLTLM